MSSYSKLSSSIREMEKEEEFELKWLKTKEISLTSRFSYIAEMHINKLVEQREKKDGG